MNNVIKTVKNGYTTACRSAHSFVAARKQELSLGAMLLGGLALISAGVVDASFAQAQTGTDRIADTGATILQGLIEGSFGALIMIVAGLTAIVAAAMGAYRTAMAALIVAVGAFILRTFVNLFFGDIIDNGTCLQTYAGCS